MMRQQRRRPISAYYSDFSVECGVASPYSAQPVSVLPHLFLGAEHNAMDVTTLNKLGITGVLNVAVEIAEDEEKEKESESTTTKSTIVTVQGKHSSPTNSNNHGIQYKSLAWTHHQQNLLSEFPEGFEFIDGIRSEGGKVLVHCQLGVSRSASMVIAYVMKTREMGLTDAYDFVKARSAVISPNMGLMYQLAEFEKSLTKKTAPSTNAGFPDLRDDDEEVYPYPTESEMEKRQEQQQEQQSPQRQEKQRSRLSRLSISAPSKSDISMEVPSTPMSLTFAFPTATPQHQSTSPPLPTATKTTSPITTRPRSSQFRMAIPVPLEVLRSSAVKDEALLSTRTFLSLSTTMATKDEDEDAMVLAPPTPLFFAEGIVSNSSSSSSPTTSTSSSRSSFAISGSSRPSSTSSAASSFINSTPFATSGVTSATTSTKMETKEILMGPLPVSQDPMTSETEDPSFATKTTAAPPPLPAVATPTPIVVAAPVPMRAHRPSLPVMASSQAQAKRTVLLRAYTQDKIGLDSHTPQHQQQPHQHYYHPSLSQHTPSSASIASSSRRSHTLATVLTRPWSNFHNSHAQQPPQQPPQPQHFFPHFARQASTVSSPSKVQDTGTGADIIDSNSAPRIRSQTVDSGGELFLVDKNSPEFIFSPRPFSPPPQSLLAASTVVDPVTTPSASTTPSTTGRIRSFGGFYQPLRMEG
ncbi:Dual specificity protein phosphatase 1 [Gryganskiella cystojenkinii]|nr:Dual specificity protein phosphatase 1 [Gryganskiella cystojenkinii]